MKYYIADTHFGHENVIGFDKRPFDSIEQMDRVLITQWNAVVTEEDDIYILGDLCFKSQKAPSWYVKQLNGRKHLIQGNHDQKLLKDNEAMSQFVSVDKMVHVQDGDHTIVLCHFPLAEWNHYYHGAWHIYGHIHNKREKAFDFMKTQERALNAGCMINNYTPVTMEQLIINNKRFIDENILGYVEKMGC